LAASDIAWALSIVLGLIFGLRALVRMAGLDAGAAGTRGMRVLESLPLGSKKRLVLVQAGEEQLLLGASETGISLLRVLPCGEDEPVDGAVAEDEQEATRPGIARRLASHRGVWTSLAVLLAVLLGSEAQAVELTSEGLVVALEGEQGLSSTLELLLLLTLVSVAPSILLMGTCFTRIVIVLAFVRQAIGVQHLPPNQVLVGLALFLTLFVMAPLAEQIRIEAYEPYMEGSLEPDQALERGLAPVRRYLMSNTREADLGLFVDLARSAASQANAKSANVDADPGESPEPSLRVLLPSFLLSELRTAFEIGFTVFLPFLVIDLVVASMLISMGMIVLPPIVVSLPFKLMLFVLVDGWNLVLTALVSGLR